MSKKPFDTRPFHLKPFSLYHHRSTMKVGTDAMLLGTWANVENVRSILDIGTGCGIVSLLLAARSMAEITAIDIDKDSIEEASENFMQSPFKERMHTLQIDLIDFSNDTSQQFDLIVSNPPFFVNNLKPDDEKRTKARHAETLTYQQLCIGTNKLIKPLGKLCVVLPYDESRMFLKIARKNGLFPKKQLIIFPREGMLPNRAIIEFSKINVGEILSEKFTIRNSEDKFTQQYIDMLKDFYLNLDE
ncbi:MAG TPA: methyltransferase [Bacteroidales bacterium]